MNIFSFLLLSLYFFGYFYCCDVGSYIGENGTCIKCLNSRINNYYLASCYPGNTKYCNGEVIISPKANEFFFSCVYGINDENKEHESHVAIEANYPNAYVEAGLMYHCGGLVKRMSVPYVDRACGGHCEPGYEAPSTNKNCILCRPGSYCSPYEWERIECLEKYMYCPKGSANYTLVYLL